MCFKMTEQNKSPLMGVKEVAAILGKSKNQTYLYCAQGAFPGIIRIGHRVFIKRLVFEKWLADPETQKSQN